MAARKKSERAPKVGAPSTGRANRTRSGGKTTSQKGLTAGEMAERRSKVWELRKRGYAFRQIATELEISVSVAHADYTACYNELLPVEEIADMRRTELDRLDHMLSKLDVGIHAGELNAMAMALRIMERRARLAGLDAPVKTELKVEAVARDDIERELAAFLAGHDAGRSGGVPGAPVAQAGTSGDGAAAS